MALLSLADAAGRYKISRTHLRRLLRDRVLSGEKFGDIWSVDEASLEAYLRTERKPGPKPGSAAERQPLVRHDEDVLRPRQSHPQRRVEYKVRTIDRGDVVELESVCTGLGMQGWRLVSSTLLQLDDHPKRLCLFFERDAR